MILNYAVKENKIPASYIEQNSLEKKYNDFCTEFSKVINTTTIKGNLVLSIHPLDYMTMSDNECNWTSCMNWKNNGCYHAGTVEMMNSTSVIVAYLENENKKMAMPNGGKWSNKKWRELFIVTNQGAVGIKPYPYFNPELEKEVLLKIKTLYSEPENFSDIRHSCEFDGNYYTNGFMYNDFGTRDDEGHPYICRITNGLEVYLPELDFCYGGTVTCLACGEIIDWEDASDLARDIDVSIETITYCGDHSGYYNVCSVCGKTTSGREQDDGKFYCFDCLDKYFMWDEFLDEEVFCPREERLFSIKAETEPSFPLTNVNRSMWFTENPQTSIAHWIQKKFMPTKEQILSANPCIKDIEYNLVLNQFTLILDHTSYCVEGEIYSSNKYYELCDMIRKTIRELYLKNIKKNNIIYM
jgi:hypothetical protein